jgi:hypothetical protein
MGVACGIASALSPPSFDEGIWLAVSRRMDLGARLYTDLIDNKTPPVYWITRILDHAPGPFSAARGAFLGAIIALLTVLAARLATKLGLARSTSLAVSVLVGGVVALQSVFVLNIETPVALLLLAGLLLVAHDREILGSAVAASASLIDVRAVAFLPAIVIFTAQRRGWEKAWRSAAAGFVVSAAWLTQVLFIRHLRYSILELNAATRGTLASWRPGQVLAVILIALAPLIVAGLANGLRPRHLTETIRTSPSGVILLVTGLSLGLASLYPFLKYWILVAPALPLLAAAIPKNSRASVTGGNKDRASFASIGFVVLACLPLVVGAVSNASTEGRLVSRYEDASGRLARSLQTRDTFASFDPQPFMTMFLPQHASMPWAMLDYLGVKTSHRGEDFRRVAAAIDGAMAIVDDGALSAKESAIEPRFRSVWRIYRARLAGFGCVRTVEGITIRLRPERCSETSG